MDKAAVLELEVTRAVPADRPVLDRLLQFYQYDFTEILGGDVRSDGRYHYLDAGPFLSGDDKHAYLVRAGGRLAGFAFVSREPARTRPSSEVWWMAEFFVMRKYRREGVGERLATAVFDLHRGSWEVGQVEANIGAQAFWRRVIGRYTSAAFEEVDMSDHRWQGPVQLFDNA